MRSDWLSTRSVAGRACLLTLGWMVITAALFGLGQLVVHTLAITDFDRRVTAWVVDRRSPPLDTAMRVVTWIGSWAAVAVVAGVVLVLRMSERATTAALFLVGITWAGEYAMVNLVKLAVARPRPPRTLWLVTAHGASFPSGHAATATLVCTAATVIVFLSSKRRTVHVATVALATLGIVGVAFSRIELGVHWTTDVLAGCLATLTWLAAIATLFAAATPLSAPGAGAVGPAPHGTAV